jgi:hypothetical protein
VERPDYIAKIESFANNRAYLLTSWATQIPWTASDTECSFTAASDAAALNLVIAGLEGDGTTFSPSLLDNCREYGWCLDVEYRVAETPLLPRERTKKED